MSASLPPFLRTSKFAQDIDTVGFDISSFAARALQSWQSLASTLDQTLLRPETTADDILQACRDASQYPFACLVVNPCWLTLAHSALSGSAVPVGSVIGFPLGDVHAVVELAHQAGVRVKVILETCLLTLEEKLRASEICLASGVDFLKTSTGFSSGGATVEDVSLLRGVAGGRCGVKASGGIRTLEVVRNMLEAGANRIGTSSGIAIVQSYIEQTHIAQNYFNETCQPSGSSR